VAWPAVSDGELGLGARGARTGTSLCVHRQCLARPARLAVGCQVGNGLGLRPRTGPGTEHDQHDAYQDEHDTADEQANTDPERVRDGQIQAPGEGRPVATVLPSDAYSSVTVESSPWWVLRSKQRSRKNAL
jgi:hypothetical protein